MGRSRNLRRVLGALLLATATAIGAAGCMMREPIGEGELVAVVNGEPIRFAELKRELAIKAKQDPSFKGTREDVADAIDTMIDQRLIVQEAMAKGLAREERFVATIRSYWEQTLVRDFIDLKKREFAEYLFATDTETRDLYRKLAKRVMFRVLRSREKPVIDRAYEAFLKENGTSIPDAELMGPFSYEDLSSDVLGQCFDLTIGEVKRVNDGQVFYLVQVASEEIVPLEPFDAVRPEIEKRVIALKERRLFDEWLKEKRKKSGVQVRPIPAVR